MAQFFDKIEKTHAKFIAAQPMFFVATAAQEGRINLSPKGMDTFRVLGPNLAGYLDLTGSGAETAAHITHDGRMTFMFNSFGPKPLILRLYGQGRIAPRGGPEYAEHGSSFPDMPGARQIIFMDVESVQTSCGYAVPRMDLVEERDVLTLWAENKGEDGVKEYIEANNVVSIDGLSTGVKT
ncbi:MAG: pyridoxamine 5'-phosphate oxidase family protein [Pseudomonadota bacterium]